MENLKLISLALLLPIGLHLSDVATASTRRVTQIEVAHKYVAAQSVDQK